MGSAEEDAEREKNEEGNARREVEEAGRRAQEQADKAAERVEASRRKLASAQRREHAWRTGAEGERQTAAALARLQEHGWVLIHDMVRPGRDRANIDHLAVGPGGVVVIDTKAWTGTIDVREGVLCRNGRRHPNALDQVSMAAAEVSALLEPHHRRLCTALVCLVGQPTPALQSAAVPVVGLDDLVDHVRARPLYLRADEIEAIAAHLRHQLLMPTPAGALTTSAPWPTTTPPPPRPPEPGRPATTGMSAPPPPRPAPHPAARPVTRQIPRPAPSTGPVRPVPVGPSLQTRASWWLTAQRRRLAAFVRLTLNRIKRLIIVVAVIWLAVTVLPFLVHALTSATNHPDPAPTKPAVTKPHPART